MQVALLPDGSRDMRFRPYIEQEETSKNVYLYDPNGSPIHHGLYDGPRPVCGSWMNLYEQYPSKTPAYIVSGSGHIHHQYGWY